MPNAPSPALPAAAINRRAVEDGLHSWLAQGTGLGDARTWWQVSDDEGGVARSSFPFATMAWLSTVPEGSDSVAEEDLGVPVAGIPDVRLHATGLRRATISVQVFSDPKAGPELSGLLRLEAALARLMLPTVRSALRAAGVGIVSNSGARKVSAGQHSAELVAYVSSAVSEDVFSIQTVAFEPGGDLVGIPAFEAPGG